MCPKPFRHTKDERLVLMVSLLFFFSLKELMCLLFMGLRTFLLQQGISPPQFYRAAVNAQQLGFLQQYEESLS